MTLRREDVERVLAQHKVQHGYGSILVSEDLVEALCALHIQCPVCLTPLPTETPDA